uniref:Putative serine carboxypeptidase lysosomal cathepsin a n=1 Tax=Amblyomma cajennense TaxID=34607 RepID=A0A023FQ36_AMBCJ
MELASLWRCLVLAGSLCLASGDESTAQHAGSQEAPKASYPDLEPLILTPWIKNCSFDIVKNKSKLDIFKQAGVNANAYSGFITVNDEAESNLFFIFIEAENNADTAPLMLWTPGGPGLPVLLSLLLQNGPVQLNASGTGFLPRELTIQKNMSVIYLDAPVGAGYSFTKKKSGYATHMENITKDIKEFLNQFLAVFEQYKKRDFYAGGDSYAARYSVALADDMLKKPDDVPLKFQGVIGGVGFLAPILDLADSSDFLLQTSMLNRKGYVEFKTYFEMMRNLTKTPNPDNYTIALGILFRTIFTSEPKTLFQNLTLYNSHASPLYTERPLPMMLSFGFANDPKFKIAIHAGMNTSLQYDNKDLQMSLIFDWLVDITDKVKYVLEHTRVLFYTGQLDALFPSANSQAYFEKLNWTHSEAYRKAERDLWPPYGRYLPLPGNITLPLSASGYTKSAGNFTSAVVLGMGHYAGFDKPAEIYKLILDFLEKKIAFSSQQVQ